MALPTCDIKPRLLFPSTTLFKGSPLPCPPIGRHSYTLTKRIFFYVHEWLLIPLSMWYSRIRGVPREPGIFPLPFGLILKRQHRIREQEGLAMNLARANGIPAPRYISFGTIDDPCHALPSMLMTRLPGIELDYLSDDEIDLNIVRDDLVKILTRMRSFASPWGNAVCGVDGGSVAGPLVPASPLPASSDEAAFKRAIRNAGHFDSKEEHHQELIVAANKLFSLPPHAIVFTHGDLNRHNIMVDEGGHVCGIFDWEAAAWLPEYWEVSVTRIIPQRAWGKFMDEQVTGGVYPEQIEGHRGIFTLTADSMSW